jgi:hypothetical protein
VAHRSSRKLCCRSSSTGWERLSSSAASYNTHALNKEIVRLGHSGQPCFRGPAIPHAVATAYTAVICESVQLVTVCPVCRLGQFIASSPTLFPPEYVAEFQQTLDRAPPVPYPAIEAILRRELGQDLDQTFSYINPVPMATASVVRSSFDCRTTFTGRL